MEIVALGHACFISFDFISLSRHLKLKSRTGPDRHFLSYSLSKQINVDKLNQRVLLTINF